MALLRCTKEAHANPSPAQRVGTQLLRCAGVGLPAYEPRPAPYEIHVASLPKPTHSLEHVQYPALPIPQIQASLLQVAGSIMFRGYSKHFWF